MQFDSNPLFSYFLYSSDFKKQSDIHVMMHIGKSKFALSWFFDIDLPCDLDSIILYFA